jgi:uncharacterized protein (DUF1697 family)
VGPGKARSALLRYVAFVGCIKVSGNQVKMTELHGALESEGFANVGTVVAHGQRMFDTDKAVDLWLEGESAQVIAPRLGIGTFAALGGTDALTGAIADNPFARDGDEKFVHEPFLEKQPGNADFAKLAKDHEGRGNKRMAAGTKLLHLDRVDGGARRKLTGDLIAPRAACRGLARTLRSMKRILEKRD